MLIITRHIDEVIHIGDEIKIIVTKINGSQVSFGIEAPKDVSILRQELLEEVFKRN